MIKIQQPGFRFFLDIPFGEDPAILPSPTFDGDITIDVLSFKTQQKDIDSYLVCPKGSQGPLSQVTGPQGPVQ